MHIGKRVSFSREHPRFAHQEIRQRAQGNRNRVGEQIVHLELTDHHFHQCQVAEDRYGSIGEIEAEEPFQRLPHSIRLRSARLRSISPGELFVPDEVMHHCGFDGDCGRREVVEVQHAFQQKQREELHGDANSADQVEFAPSHERGEWRVVFKRRSRHPHGHCGILSSR
ncbi:MAG: hypothetical protein WB781_12035 [Candidatus Sulfotelmatobacter sp.]